MEDDMFNTGRKVKWRGKLLGYYIKGERGLIFISPRKSYHKFRMYDGWGINELFLKHLIGVAVSQIRLIIDGGKKVLIVTPENWFRKGIPHRSKGYEPQIILREKDFDIVRE